LYLFFSSCLCEKKYLKNYCLFEKKYFFEEIFFEKKYSLKRNICFGITFVFYKGVL